MFVEIGGGQCIENQFVSSARVLASLSELSNMMCTVVSNYSEGWREGRREGQREGRREGRREVGRERKADNIAVVSQTSVVEGPEREAQKSCPRSCIFRVARQRTLLSQTLGRGREAENICFR